MAEWLQLKVPDIGDTGQVEVVEVLVAVGDTVAVDDGLVTLESDKASMDVPATAAGIVKAVKVAVGDKVQEGDVVVELEAEDATQGPPPASGATHDSQPSQPETSEDSEAQAKPQTQAKPASLSAPRSAADDLQAEVLVLGSGPAGYTAAFRAADLGKKVVLVERYASLGGVCLNVGCIPSKALLHVSRVLDEVEHLSHHGVRFGEPEIDLGGLRNFKQSVVDRLTGGLDQLASKRGVQVIQGEGLLSGLHELTVSGETPQRVVFEQAILAVGSRVVRIPGIPYDDPRVIDSTGALKLEDVPQKLLVIGGGIIGLEMAMVYGALGSQLTIVELMDDLIPGCDPDLVRPLKRKLKKQMGAEIFLGSKVLGVEAQERSLRATFEGGKAPASAEFDKVLVAVGRRPNGDRIGAEAAGLHVDEKGFVPVDRQQRTNVAHIFAIGDLTGQPMLAHKGTHEGKVAAEVAAGEQSSFDARVIPSVAYTDPEIAWVGLTETEAKGQGIVYEKGSFPWGASGRSLGMGRSEGLTKILFDPQTDRILGAGIVGPNAGDLIAELTLAIEMDCEASDLALTIHPHPTLSETIAFSAEAYEGTLTDLYVPKKKKKAK